MLASLGSTIEAKLDIVSISEDDCFISDLKTSAPSIEHHEQMRIYAMLWDGDNELNPSGISISALDLVYSSGLVKVPIADDLRKFRIDVTTRTDVVINDLSLPVIPAKPSKENCRYCQVKLLCDPYWSDVRAYGNKGETVSNVILVAEECRSDSTWFVKVLSSDSPFELDRVVLKKFDGGSAFWSEIEQGMTIRLTDVIVRLRADEDLPLVALTMLSEALFV
jgi:hypothetical protein